MKSKFGVLIGCMLLLMTAAAYPCIAADDPVGYMQSAQGQVDVTCQSGTSKSGAYDMPILPNDTITTGADSSAQIMFIDKTVLALAENSKVEVFDVYTPEKGGLFDLSFFEGTARLVTSDILHSAPEKFSASTPLGTIGIRGTELGLLADPGHEVVMLYDGGPAIYTDGQIPGVSLEQQTELCKDLSNARKKVQRAYNEVRYGMNIIAKRKAEKQLEKILAAQKEFKCAP